MPQLFPSNDTPSSERISGEVVIQHGLLFPDGEIIWWEPSVTLEQVTAARTRSIDPTCRIVRRVTYHLVTDVTPESPS